MSSIFAIRPFLVDNAEKAGAPEGFETLPAMGKGFEGLGYKFRLLLLIVQAVENCADICPGKKGEKALIMKPIENSNS